MEHGIKYCLMCGARQEGSEENVAAPASNGASVNNHPWESRGGDSRPSGGYPSGVEYASNNGNPPLVTGNGNGDIELAISYLYKAIAILEGRGDSYDDRPTTTISSSASSLGEQVGNALRATVSRIVRNGRRAIEDGHEWMDNRDYSQVDENNRDFETAPEEDYDSEEYTEEEYAEDDSDVEYDDDDDNDYDDE